MTQTDRGQDRPAAEKAAMKADRAQRSGVATLRRMGDARASQTCQSCLVRRRGLCSPLRDDHAILALEAAHLPLRSVEAGAVIFHQGDACDRIYNVISGWISFHHDLPDGRHSLTQIALPGDMFGLAAEGASLAQTATALTPSVICAMSMPRFTELRHAHPQLTDRLVQMMERDAALALDGLANARVGSAETKLAHLFWSLSVRSLRRRPKPAERIWVPLTQRHLGSATGLTPVHVSRVLRRWREGGLLEHRNPWLELLQPDLLETAACTGEEFLSLWASSKDGPRRPDLFGTA